MYTNTNELLELLKREKLWAQKKIGQNFLVNPEVLNKIIEAAELTKDDHVLEIGPGLGILTEQLAKHAGKVTSIELDRNIIPILKKNLGLTENSTKKQTSNIEIIHQDALKTELPTHPYKLVANIPYYITSPILNHFLQPDVSLSEQDVSPVRPSLIVLLVQKEVAQKICAKDGDQSILSLQVQAFGKPTIVCNVGKSSFFPQPQVESAVIKIETFANSRVSNVEIFLKLIKAAFSQKRKMLSNTIPHTLNLDSHQAEKFFMESKITSDKRPQNLKLEDWEQLIQAYLKISKS